MGAGAPVRRQMDLRAQAAAGATQPLPGPPILPHLPQAGAFVQAAALTGAASGLGLALLALLAPFRSLPAVDGEVNDLIQQFAALRIGISPLRVLLTGALLTAVTATLVRLWPQRSALVTSLPERWRLRASLWGLPFAVATRFVVTATAVSTLAILVAVVIEHDRPSGAGAWVAVLLALPTAAVAAVELATGSTFQASGEITGALADTLHELDSLFGGGDGSLTSRRGSYGLLQAGHSHDLGLLTTAAVLLLALTTVRVALKRDPRERPAGLWWRTGLAFSFLWAITALMTTTTLAIKASVPTSGSLSSALGDGLLGGSAHASAGPTLLSALGTAFVVGVVAAAGHRALPRAAAGALPHVLVRADRLPGRLHPLWALLLVDAGARLGTSCSPAVRAAAGAAAATAPSGLQPLTVDPRRTRATVVGAALLLAATVVLPIVHHVLSTTVFGPRAAAAAFSRDLDKGDAAKLRAAADSPTGPGMSDAALRFQRATAPITDVSMTMGAVGKDSADAVIDYRVNGTQQRLPVRLITTSAKRFGMFPTWTASVSMPSVTVDPVSSASSSCSTGSGYPGPMAWPSASSRA